MAGRFSVEAVFKAVDRVTAPVSRMQNRISKMTRSMTRGLRSITKVLGKVARGIGGVARTAAKIGVTGIVALTGAVTLLVREFAKIEDAEAAFTPLLGSVKKAKELVEELNKTAASTPFQFGVLADVANQLLPIMDGNIKNVIKTLRMLGDTAGGKAQKLDTIARGFTKAMLKGKVDLESLNMIAEAGVPIFQELADTLGVKVNAAFFKMISAGKISTDDLIKTFENMTGKAGLFEGGMAIASRTTSGMLSTLRDNISLTAASIGGVLAPTIKELISDATGAAVAVREWVKQNKEMIGTKFTEFVTSLRGAIGNVATALSELASGGAALDSVKTIITGIGNAIVFMAEHGATVAKVTVAVVALSLAMGFLSGVLTLVGLVLAANPITLAVVGIVAAAAAIFAAWDPLKVFFKDLWAGITLEFDAGVASIMRVIDRINTAIKSVTGSIRSVTDATTGIASKGISTVKNFFGFGGDEEGATSAAAPQAQVIAPSDRVARSIEETTTTNKTELTIKDETGRAEITKGVAGTGIKLIPSGSF